jgi:hypothetical protein
MGFSLFCTGSVCQTMPNARCVETSLGMHEATQQAFAAH